MLPESRDSPCPPEPHTAPSMPRGLRKRVPRSRSGADGASRWCQALCWAFLLVESTWQPPYKASGTTLMLQMRRLGIRRGSSLWCHTACAWPDQDSKPFLSDVRTHPWASLLLRLYDECLSLPMAWVTTGSGHGGTAGKGRVNSSLCREKKVTSDLCPFSVLSFPSCWHWFNLDSLAENKN